MKAFWFLFVAALAGAASAQTNLPLPELPAMTNARPALATTNLTAVERPPTEIFSDTADFDLKNRIGVYRGHVRVTDPQMQMTCDLLTALVSTNGGRPESIIASGNVKVEGLDDRGRSVRLTCDKAVNLYQVTSTATNDTITLTGNVYVDSAMFKGTGDPIIWDRVHDTIHVENQDMQIQPEIKKTGTNVPPVNALFK